MSVLRKIDPRHWTTLRRGIDVFRATFFSVSGAQRQLKLDESVTVEELREELGRRHFAPSWDLSYYYDGEDLNMVQFRYDENVSADRPWQQLHVRAFAEDDGVEVSVHDEMSAKTHPAGHYRAHALDIERGVGLFTAILDDAGIEYTDARVSYPDQ